MGKTEIVQDSNVAVQPQRAHAVSVGAPAVQTTIVPASSGCECGTPAYATCAAKTTCVASVFVLVIHIINLLVALLSVFFWFQTVPNLIAVIMSGVLLCCYSRCGYITASVLYWIVLALEIGNFMFWFWWVVAQFYLFMPFVLGIVALLVAAIAASISCCDFVERPIAVTTNVVGNAPVLQTTLPQHVGLSYHGQPEMAMIQPVARPSGTYYDHPNSVVYSAPQAKATTAGIVPTGHDLEAGNGKRAGHVLSNAARAQPDEYDFSMPVAITGARNFEQNLSRPSHQSNAATGRSSSGNSGSVARDRSSPPPPFEEAMGSKCK